MKSKKKRIDGYSQEEIDYIRKIGDSTNRINKEITEMFNKKFNQNRSVTAIIQIKSRNNIKSYTRVYTDEQIDYIRGIALGRSNKEITRLFNEKFNDTRTENSIKSIRFEHGILTGNTGRFKKGNKPHNTDMVGTEKIREDGYVYIKIKEPNVWKAKHHIVWENHYGPLPDENVILFGDGNRENFDIYNLIPISRAQLLQLNRHGLIQKDADLTRTGIIIVDIHQKIGERKKE